MMTKWFRSLSVALVAATLLGGCGTSSSATSSTPNNSSQSSTPAQQPKPADPVTLEVWIMPNSAQPDVDLKDVLKPFTDQHPNYTINVTTVDWGSAWTKITAAATSGEGPDILQLGTTWVPAIAAMNALTPITDKVAEVGGKDAYNPASWQSTGIAGKPDVYAVPWFVDAHAFFYRTDVFKKAGVDPTQAFQSWDNFKQALQKINGTEIDGKKIAAIGFPGKNDWNVLHNMVPWVWEAGGSELSADFKTAALNTDSAVDAVMFYTGLAHDGLVPKAVLEKNTADAEAMFAQGDFAVMLTGSDLIQKFMTPKDKGGYADTTAAKNYGVSPMPAGPKGRYTFFGGSDLSIFKASKHQKEAWEVVKYLSGKDAQLAYAKVSGGMPAVTAVRQDPFFSGNPIYVAFADAMKYGRSYPAIPGWGPVEGVLIKHFGTVWDITAGVSGTYSRDSIKKELDAATQEVNDLLKQAQ